MKHSPEGWADIARKYESEERWVQAERAWFSARGASVGHNRRDRYERAARRCELRAEYERMTEAKHNTECANK